MYTFNIITLFFLIPTKFLNKKCCVNFNDNMTVQDVHLQHVQLSTTAKNHTPIKDYTTTCLVH